MLGAAPLGAIPDKLGLGLIMHTLSRHLAVAGACAFGRFFLEAARGPYLPCPSDRASKSKSE